MLHFLYPMQILLVLGGCHADDVARAPMDSELIVESGELDKQTAQDLLDSALGDGVDLGSEAGWSAYFDPESQLILARRGESSMEFDLGELDDIDPELLDHLRLPPQVVSSWQGKLCRAACWGAAAAGCSAVGAACVGATTISVGGVAVPCAHTTIAACFVSGSAGSYCSDWCTDQYG